MHNGYKNHITAEFVLVSDNSESSYNDRLEVVREALDDARSDLRDDDDVPLSDENEATARSRAGNIVMRWIDECIEAMIPPPGVLCDFAHNALVGELYDIDSTEIADAWVEEALFEEERIAKEGAK